MEPLGFCPHPHPFGATYRLQHIAWDGAEKANGPRAVLCPWCDWGRLRGVEKRRDASGILKVTLKNSLR